ncbi:MAG: amino acid permease [Nitrososphaerota archaeon]|nr:APC family permease [Nitrososphaerota archaeon]MDG6931253.1 amino acid permease [Nitrososphaerota archaeon]
MNKKGISMWQATAIGIGNIIGAGIFVLAGSVIYQAGPGALFSFMLTAVLAITVALNSAELSSKIVAHGGLYSFVKETMGESTGFIVGWLRAISYAIATSAVALGFSSYLLTLLSTQSIAYELGLALALMAFAVALNYIGVRVVAELEELLVVLTTGGLIIFIAVSIIYGKWVPARFTPFFPNGPFSIVESASLAFFAYSGFNTVATLTPEIRDGKRNAPRAIMLSLAVSTILYILVVVGMLALMPWKLYAVTADPLLNALSFSRAPLFVDQIVGVVALVATVTVTLSLIVAGSRTLLQMSDDGLLPRVLGGKDDSPKRAVILIGTIAMISIFLGNIQYIALASNFGVIFSYSLTGLAVYLVRKRGIKGPFNSPLYPYVQVVSVLLSVVIMIALGVQALYVGAVTIMFGIFLYVMEKEGSRGRNNAGNGN